MSKFPNSSSTILSGAIIGGIGFSLPPNQAVPKGMGCVLLYVPLEEIVGDLDAAIDKAITQNYREI